MNVVRMVIGAAVCATLLAACGGSAEKPETPPTEQQSLDRSARLAFAQGRYDQAASLYEAALLAALKEDAPQAIVDARFNLALCQTYQGQYAEALDQLEQAEAERLRRGVVGEGSIELLRGTIHYRSGQLDKARLVLQTLLVGDNGSAATATKAHFVLGLIAADQGDIKDLSTHLNAIGADAVQASATDRLELTALLSALQGEADQALAQLEQVARLRRDERDYRGMVRVLAKAGDVAEHAQRIQSAGRYLLRAGRSAAQRREPETRGWLERAEQLASRAGDTETAREARELLNGLEDKAATSR
ncbi:tetratricopeptide repeat protein [Thiosocius teredinicola]|uniref:tetratricopeptide repeat protein n=1 Tax=Thiosocius teredinicola TaxID=1973002 RepID=UPI000991033F